MSNMDLGVLLGFTAAFTFVGQNFWLRELQAREGPWRYLFLINAAPAAAGILSWIWMPPDLSLAIVLGSLYASLPGTLGMLSLGLAVHYGDISHVGPIIGGKALIVTALAAGLGLEPTTPELWAASAVLLVAVFLISGNREVLTRPWRAAEPAVLLAVGFCVAYGACDLITRRQMALHDFSPWDFIVMNWIVRSALTGAGLAVFARLRRERFLPRRWSTFGWTIPATLLHGIAFTGSLKYTDSAVLTNVLVSVRGLLSVIAVVVLSRWGLVRREPMTRPVLIARVAGSLLICAAVYLGLQGGLRSR